MARKLKVFQTSLGFFDQAIAAPSMKAALEAWGADSNLFHQGAAKESKDPDVVVATMAKPGVVLKRPVGSDGPFTEHADLPTDLGQEGSNGRHRKPAKLKQRPPRKTDDKATRKAAFEYEKEEKRRKLERQKEEAAREKERKLRQQAVEKAQAALDEAEGLHAEKSAAIDAERDVLEKRLQAEDTLWEKQKRKLEGALRRARET
jgi:hypothetical protein